MWGPVWLHRSHAHEDSTRDEADASHNLFNHSYNDVHLSLIPLIFLLQTAFQKQTDQ